MTEVDIEVVQGDHHISTTAVPFSSSVLATLSQMHIKRMTSCILCYGAIGMVQLKCNLTHINIETK